MVAPTLDTSLQYLKGVGPNLAELFRNKDIYTIEDALYFLPRAYEDRKNIKKIKALVPGNRETSFGFIRRIAFIPMKTRRRKMLVITIADSSGFISAKWFRYNQQYMSKRYKVGMPVVFSGDVKIFRYQKEITHPDIEIIDEPGKNSLHFGRIVPIYSLTQGLYQKTIRKITSNALDVGLQFMDDPLPQSIIERQKLLNLATSFKEVHFPTDIQKTSDEEALTLPPDHPARRRLVFDEFFFLELGLALKRKHRTEEKTKAYPGAKSLKKQLLDALPFELTAAQQNVIAEVEKDLAEPFPMNRLLQGDVGSGKTLASLVSSLPVLKAGYQVTLMVPTEILAEQHFKTIRSLLSKLKIRCCLLKSDIKKSDKTKLYQEIKSGYFQFIVGTHAVIQKDVTFKNLGLLVVDEQHRFGVEQRLQLKEKGDHPHLLVMTATPIPRTLALTVYGDLDISIIDELPKGRKPITTKVVREAQRLKLYTFMKEQIGKGKQAYVVYPLIKESEKIDLRDATQMSEHLKRIFSDFKVELMHGKMKSDQKNEIMKRFKENATQILVSTTVIEVGIDVPNSTIMVVEHAERFGLSQLHQLRGRIGRGADKSYCFLLPDRKSTNVSKERLKAMEQYQSGFKISEVDLQIRGPGEFMGTRQSGLAGFKIANLATDTQVLLQARKEAFDIVTNDPTLSTPENKSIKTALQRRWQKKFDLMTSG